MAIHFNRWAGEGFNPVQMEHLFQQCMAGTAFWFVPNMLMALGVILMWRRFLDDPRAGIVFLSVSLFYGVNIYGHWLPVLHTQATFGFIFYFWLGAWCARHRTVVEKWLARIPAEMLIALILLTMALATAESTVLLAMGSIDPTNTLRISNQIYSLLAVLAIVKVRRPLWPRTMKVREYTFGLYLTQTVFLFLLVQILNHAIPHLPAAFSLKHGSVALMAIPFIFLFTYAGCFAIVRFLMARPKLRWIVGAARPAEYGSGIENPSEIPQGSMAGSPVVVLGL